jgi:acetyl-CoA acetyltransferase
MPSRVQAAPPDFYRTKEGLGIWKGKGNVVAVGIGVSPTTRRWDWNPETSVGSWSIIALRRAMEDAGVKPEEVDGLVMAQDTTTGYFPWPPGFPPGRDIIGEMSRRFKPTDDPKDGIAQLSAEWILQNMPELKNVKFTMYAPTCMANCVVVAEEAVARGLTNTCLVLKGWHNFEGRYYVGRGTAAEGTASGRQKWTLPWGTVSCYQTAMQFQRYLDKYGKTHDMNANFVINSRRNGLLFPEGYFYQHRPEPITKEDYLRARWIAKPANLFDNDMPTCVSGAFLYTTAERARNMKQKPVYILNHASDRTPARSLMYSLEEVEEIAARNARKMYEGAGITARDLSFENLYDGFSEFHLFHLEGLGFAGIKRGEGLDFYQSEDISIEGPHPVSPSGGNIGSGRSRFWNHIDCLQQIQHRAGKRQVTGVKTEVAVCGGYFPYGGNFMVYGASPD